MKANVGGVHDWVIQGWSSRSERFSEERLGEQRIALLVGSDIRDADHLKGTEASMFKRFNVQAKMHKWLEVKAICVIGKSLVTCAADRSMCRANMTKTSKRCGMSVFGVSPDT